MNAQLKPVPHFARESVRDVMGEIEGLLDEHALEVGHRPVPVGCDFQRYLKADALGVLRLFTVRLEGDLIAYLTFFVSTNLHYMSQTEAVQDAVFMSARARKGSLGMRFLKWSVAQLWLEPQIDEVQLRGKVVRDLEPLFERMGFKRMYYSYSRRR
jgi:hypothetical protein